MKSNRNSVTTVTNQLVLTWEEWVGTTHSCLWTPVGMAQKPNPRPVPLKECRASQMVQQVKVPAAKPDDRVLSLESPWWKESTASNSHRQTDINRQTYIHVYKRAQEVCGFKEVFFTVQLMYIFSKVKSSPDHLQSLMHYKYYVNCCLLYFWRNDVQAKYLCRQTYPFPWVFLFCGWLNP